MLTNLPDKSYRLATGLIFGLLSIIVLLTFRHYGVTWDEEIQNQYGQAVYDYYASGFVDLRYNEIFNLYLYGGMFDGLASILDHFTPITVYETRHLLNAVVGLIGLWGTWKLGKLFGGGFVGLMSMILLLLTPMYYGHMFNNPKDIPFAAGIVWSLYYMCRTLMLFPRVRLPLILKLGIIYGLTLGVRVGGIMILGYWGLAMTVLAFIQAKPWTTKTVRATILNLARVGVPVAVISYTVMLACWPWAQEAPLLNPLKALAEFSNFPQDVEVLLNGTIFDSTELPWYYVPVYFYVQLPVLQLFLVTAGLILLPVLFVHMGWPGKRASLCLVVLTLAVPVFYAMFRHPALYDAVRHFIFLLPPLCILGALVMRDLIAIGKARTRQISNMTIRKVIRVIALIMLCFGLAVPISAMIELHPYEYIYVNEIEGGVEGAFGHYELDYWGSSFKEAAEKLQSYVAKEGGVPAGKIYKLAICGPWASAMIYLPPDYEPVEANEPADFFLATTRWRCEDMRGDKEVVRIERMGAPLSIIKDLRGTEDGRLGMPNYREDHPENEGKGE